MTIFISHRRRYQTLSIQTAIIAASDDTPIQTIYLVNSKPIMLFTLAPGKSKDAIDELKKYKIRTS